MTETTTPILTADLTEAQLEGRACVRCGDETGPHRPVEAWSERSTQLFECVDSEACQVHSQAARR